MWRPHAVGFACGLAALFMAGQGCVLGVPGEDVGGPELLSVNPPSDSLDVSRNQSFVLEFDRPLAPRAIGAESIRLVSGARRFAVRVTSDPTARTLEVVPGRPLDPEVGYRIEVGPLVDVEGFASEPLTLRFTTGSSTTPTEPPPTWAQAAVVLGACSGCHGGETPVLGLDLSSAEGVSRTAIGVPAQEVEVGDPVRAGGGLWGLSRIEPGFAERSFLIWKLTGDEHVPGERMPRDEEPLDAVSVGVLVAWIRAGAPTD